MVKKMVKVRSKNQAKLVERKQATKVENKTGSYVTELIIRIFLALIVLFLERGHGLMFKLENHRWCSLRQHIH